MGTSTSHRSPATAEWDRVRELYLTPNPSPGEIVGRIVEALDAAARQRLYDAATVSCLDAVLSGSHDVAEGGYAVVVGNTPGGYAALSLASGLRARAAESIAEDSAASVMGCLALEAIPPTVISALGSIPAWHELPASTVARQYGRYARERELGALAGQFVGQDLEQVFRYFVARDLSDFIGQAAAPTVVEGTRLADRVGDFCRERGTVRGLRPREPDLQEIVYLPRTERTRALAPLMKQGVLEGLADLAGG